MRKKFQSGIPRRKAIKLGVAGSLGSLGLIAGSSTEAAAATSEPQDQWSDGVDTKDETTGDDIIVSQGTNLAWYNAASNDAKNAWVHDMAITTTATGWVRDGMDGSYKGPAGTISSTNWEIDLSGASSSDTIGWAVNPNINNKYSGAYPKSSGDLVPDFWETTIKAAVGIMNPTAGAVISAADILAETYEDDGLTQNSTGWTFEHSSSPSMTDAGHVQRFNIEVPYDVDPNDVVKISAWSPSGLYVAEVSFYCYFAGVEDSPPAVAESTIESDTDTKSLDPNKMTSEEKEKYGVQKVTSEDTRQSAITTSEQESSSSPEYVATNLPLAVEVNSKSYKKTNKDK